nr:MAG TPA: Protein RibT [Caudoviricetes sp.]
MSKMWECGSIQEIDFESAKRFIGKQKDLILKPDYKYFVLINDGVAKSILGAQESNTIKIHCNYTPIDLRGKGYFGELLRRVCSLYADRVITADCLDTSKNIYLNNGFSLVYKKEYKHFNIYRVKRG